MSFLRTCERSRPGPYTYVKTDLQGPSHLVFSTVNCAVRRPEEPFRLSYKNGQHDMGLRVAIITKARTFDIHSSIRARSLPTVASTRYLGCNGAFAIVTFSSFSTSVVKDDGGSSTFGTGPGDLGNRSGRNVRFSHAFNRARFPSPSVPTPESWRDRPPFAPRSVRVSARARLKGFEVVPTSS